MGRGGGGGGVHAGGGHWGQRLHVGPPPTQSEDNSGWRDSEVPYAVTHFFVTPHVLPLIINPTMQSIEHKIKV